MAKIQLVQGGQLVNGEFQANPNYKPKAAPTPTSTASPEITALSKSMAPTIPVSVVENPPPVAPVTTTPVDISPVNATLGAAQGLLDADLKEKDATLKAEERKNSSQEMLLRGYMEQYGMRSADQFAFEQSAGLPQKTADYNKILNRIRIQTDSMNNSDDKAFFDQVNLETDGSSRDVTKGVVGAQQARVARERAIQRVGEAARVRANMATAALMQGDIELARDNVQKAMSAKYDPIKASIENEKYFLSRYDNQLSDAQKAQSDARKTQLNFQLQTIERAQRAMEDATPLATPQELEEMMGAQPQLAYQMAQQIINRASQAPAPSSGMAAPTVKTINGVDMQWNPTIGQWENIGGASTADPQREAKYTSLINDISKAMGMTDAVGAGWIERNIKNAISGNNKTAQLQNIADTIKSNLLTLNTDPAIKKFFGPQMSNRDTELMMAAATTLNPVTQSKAEFEKDLRDAAELIMRARAAVKSASTSQNQSMMPTVITAPDGRQIQIID